MANDIYGDFYNPTKLLSSGKAYLFSIGVRSSGKSTGWLIHLLKEYMKYGKQFIYMRRDKDELDNNAYKAFNNAHLIYNDYYKGKKGYPMIESIEYKAGTYIINGKVAGYAIPLSVQQKYKSLDFSNVYYAVYDEFLISKSGGHYLGGQENIYKEAEAVMSLFITVDRRIGQSFRNELKMIFIGNNETYMNPIFMRLNIDRYLNAETRFCNPKDTAWCLEQTTFVQALADAKLSNAYALSSDYSKQYAFEGGLFSEDFIGKPECRTAPLFSIAYNNNIFTVCDTEDHRNIFVTTKKATNVCTLALTGPDHKPDYRLVKEWRNNYYMLMLKEAIQSGRVLYENNKCKYAIETFYKYDK